MNPGTTLTQILNLLANPESSVATRNEAARLLGTAYHGWVRSTVQKAWFDAPDELIEDATQHLLLKASVGTARFKGNTEAEAFAWCKSVVRNFVIDELRRVGQIKDGESPDDYAGIEIAGIPGTSLIEDLEKLLSRLMEAVERRTSPKNIETVRGNILCYWEARIEGKSLEEQIEEWGFSGAHASTPRNEVSLRKARDRVFQQRRRGKKAGYQALSALRREDAITAEDAVFLIRLLGFDDETESEEASPRKRNKNELS